MNFKIIKIAKKKSFTLEKVDSLSEKFNIDWKTSDFSIYDLKQGLEVEYNEHISVHSGNISKAMEIALDHLRESSIYYKKLKIMENQLEAHEKRKEKNNG